MKQIVGFFVSQGCVADSQGKTVTNNILDFLLSYRFSVNCFYHLSYNVACILRILNLNEEQLKKLYEVGDLFIEPDYTIYYLHNKYFAIKKGFVWDCPYVQFCDVSQYIPHRIENDQSLEYALVRAKEAQVIGHLVYGALQDLDMDPDNMTSPIRVFEKRFLNRLSLPTVDDMPEQAGEYAYYCTHGGWLEAFKKGHWLEAYDYDISSAYPYWLTQLKDLRYGEWLQSTQYQAEAEYGYLYGEVTIEKHFSPILYGATDMTYTPVGTWDTYITKGEYEAIYKHGLGSFQIFNAWWWFGEKCKAYPLQSTIERLYQVKERTDGIARDVTKRIMSGCWGKLLEVKGDSFGDHFNPCWGAEVEANTRLQVFEACVNSGLVPLSIAVDGVLTDKPLLVPLNNGLGSWKMSSQCPALVVSSGVVAVKDKEHNHDFSLDYDWLLAAIQQYPYAASYEKSKPSPVSLDKSFNYNDLSKLGTVETITRAIDVTYEQKRCYLDRPTMGSDLLNNKYESVAWDVSFLRAEE